MLVKVHMTAHRNTALRSLVTSSTSLALFIIIWKQYTTAHQQLLFLFSFLLPSMMVQYTLVHCLLPFSSATRYPFMCFIVTTMIVYGVGVNDALF